MSSVIEDVYTALDGLTITYLDKDNVSTNPTCYTLSESLDSIETAHLPCRLLLPPTSDITLKNGSGLSSNYIITDLFLLEAVGQGGGSKIEAPVLLRYMKAYQDAIADKFQYQGGWQAEIISASVRIAPGKYNYPAQSEAWFYGVKCDINIQELF